MQVYWPWHPQHLCTGSQLFHVPQLKINSLHRHKCIAAGTSLPSTLTPRSTLRQPPPLSQLMTSVKTTTAIILLLNDYLISKGKPPLGFLNPWLYGGGLGGPNDIITGSKPGCGTCGFSTIVDGTLFVLQLLRLHSQCLLTLESIGHRSWDTKLLQTAGSPVQYSYKYPKSSLTCTSLPRDAEAAQQAV